MEIHHKIRPVHGWRAFFGEVGIIVLGVLIALGAEQVVEWFHWRHSAETAYEAIGGELARVKAVAIERIRAYSCVERRLDELATIVDRSERAGRLSPLGGIGAPPSRPLEWSVWESVQQSDLPNHLSRERRTALGQAYYQTRLLAEAGERELPLWTELYQLSGPGRPFDPQSAASARAALAQARITNRYISLISAQLLDDMRTGKIEMDKKDPMLVYLRNEDVREASICRAIGTEAPVNYGQAPWENIGPEIVLAPGQKGPVPAPAY